MPRSPSSGILTQAAPSERKATRKRRKTNLKSDSPATCIYYFTPVSFMPETRKNACHSTDLAGRGDGGLGGWTNPLSTIERVWKIGSPQQRSSFTSTDDILRLGFARAFNQNNIDEWNFHDRKCFKKKRRIYLPLRTRDWYIVRIYPL